MKRALTSILAGAAMLSASASFALATPLAPGGAAGVQKAQVFNNDTLLAIAGGAVVIGGIAYVLSSNGNGSVGVLTTCTPTSTGQDCSTGSGGSGGSSGTTGTP